MGKDYQVPEECADADGLQHFLNGFQQLDEDQARNMEDFILWAYCQEPEVLAGYVAELESGEIVSSGLTMWGDTLRTFAELVPDGYMQ